MRCIQYSSNEAVYYDYQTESDELLVKLDPDSGPTEEETLAEHPNICLQRDRQSGELVGLRVSGVQDLILQHLVRDLVSLAKSQAGSPATAEQAPPTATVEEQPAEAGGSPETVQVDEDPSRQASGDRHASKGRNRRRGGKSGSRHSQQEQAESSGSQAEAQSSAPEEGEQKSASAETSSSSRRRRRRGRRKRNRNEDQAQAGPDTADQVPAGEAGPGTADQVPAGEAEAGVPGDSERDERREQPPAAASAKGNGEQHARKTEPVPGLETPAGFQFEGMHPLLGQAVAAMGFEEPTPIQRRAVPPGLAGKDLIGLAQTGTGKTLAFLIPGFNQLLNGKRRQNHPRMLVLTPTRELAVQVAEEGELLATHTDLHITRVYGGVGLGPQKQKLQQGTDIIVATPGRLLDHLNRKNVRLNDVEVLVLDEADRMLDMGFVPEVRSILRRLPHKRRTMLFSATMPPAIQHLSMEFQNEPELIEVARQLPPTSIDQLLYPVEKHLKTPLLIYLLQNDETLRSVLVFTERKSEADILARKLREAKIDIEVMHGDRSQRERERALRSLNEGNVRVLVATNVAARGLDVTGITHVINYDMPQSVDDYVHRIGRTARGEATGKAYTFVSIGDEPMAARVESALERELPRRYAEGFNYDVPAPSWAKPTAEDIAASLHKPKGLADRFRRMMRR